MRRLFCLFLLANTLCFGFVNNGRRNNNKKIQRSVNLSWMDSDVGATFNLWKGGCGNETLDKIDIPTTNYTDTAVQSGQTICYFVTATTVNGDSLPSNEIQVVIL